MEFEFDDNKSKVNQKKHGIDFVAAQVLWEDANLIEFPVQITGEERFLVVGKISEKYWTGCITYRAGRIRIISVRPSRKEETQDYENEKNIS